ncbi:DNA-protecting protein DprA [Chitinophaga silvatica]|uniref:DNA-protecting protein DprA n=1 Tax=Chitinophaga silvatica TaxID=2282649 RepID=A0A3E1YDJ0_9BACT|nr:DNA-processing protein DprA [Chitinophaga silvatica]RFS24582.1 DNA-protecting protein DprA [Chitinophaga silvatica]
MPSELMYQLALTRIPLIGDVIIKKLLEHFSSAESIFKAKKNDLERIMNIGSIRAGALKSFNDFAGIEAEINFLDRYKIKPLFCTDSGYPRRLLECYDTPAMLYYKGNTDLNSLKMVSIVGTRKPSAYGVMLTEKLVNDFKEAGIIIVSGLAYGIDVIAHASALKAGIPTIGVLAHGLDRIYPPVHKGIAAQMVENGGLLTDFPSGTLPDKQNFPRRNRIVAGLCDVTIVVESSTKGGSLITADLANGYNRDVCCFPGRTTDLLSEGCNWLIRQNKAALITSAAEVLEMMGWNERSRHIKKISHTLFPVLTEAERGLLDILQERSPRHLEEFYSITAFSGSQIANAMFGLEMQQLVKRLPGQMYELM